MTNPFDSSGYPMGANPSFADVLRRAGQDAAVPRPVEPGALPAHPHGTTVLALSFADGLVMAGDRRATEGYSIADERTEKVFPADAHSLVSIAGAAGQAVEMVRLFQTELEHYEKVEGESLSLEGKANRLAQMIRGNFGWALQGLIVVPLFGGYDLRRGEGRLFRYDVTGGRWEEFDHHATGSGGQTAKATLKKRWRPGLSRDEAVRAAVEALYDASQEDIATGGIDPIRGIFPTVKVAAAGGVTDVTEDEVRAAFEAIVAERVGTEPLGRTTPGQAEAER
ncbi:MAG TPA: proteasome subunit beta [Actinomycetota bacterium]|nr:proteasome subunit beta [Actinomycetota bacterium]